MAATKLPLLPLPYPIILLPSCTSTLFVDYVTSQKILELRRRRGNIEDALTVAAVPAAVEPPLGQKVPPALSQWATAARVVRMMRGTAEQGTAQAYVLVLHGVARIRLSGAKLVISETESIQDVEVTYPAFSKQPPVEAVEQFRSAALKLLEKLANQASHSAKRSQWLKLSNMTEEMLAEGDISVVDRLVAALKCEFMENLGAFPGILLF
jgi:ATP-dependent Lon protease